MKVKAITNYFDKVMNKAVTALDEFEVSDARAIELAGSDNDAKQPLVEILEEPAVKIDTVISPETDEGNTSTDALTDNTDSDDTDDSTDDKTTTTTPPEVDTEAEPPKKSDKKK